MAAKNIAFAPRGGAALVGFLKSDVPELSLQPGTSDAGPVGAEPLAVNPITPEKKGGCAGCSTSPGTNVGALGLIGLVVAFVRRKSVGSRGKAPGAKDRRSEQPETKTRR